MATFFQIFLLIEKNLYESTVLNDEDFSYILPKKNKMIHSPPPTGLKKTLSN